MYIVMALLACTCGLFRLVHALDLPQFYRATFFQTEPTDKTKNWATLVSARLATGRTRDSFDVHDHKRPLYSLHGPFNLVRLGFGLENPGVVTTQYWNKRPLEAGLFDNLTNLGPDDGTADYSGRFKINAYDFELKQNLFWGFYAHVYMPVRDVKVDQIAVHRRGAQFINTPGGPENMDTFIAEKLPLICQEAGLEPFSSRFKKSGISDVVVSAGWQKCAELSRKELLTSLSGFAQVGLLIPAASEHDLDNVFAIPLGYDNNYGVLIQGGAETCVLNFVSVGLQAEATIFFRDNRQRRMMTDPAEQQNGWIVLENKAWIGFDQGTVWDVGVYAKFDKLFKGFYATIGYSYAKQEPTKYHVKSDWFLENITNYREQYTPGDTDWGFDYYFTSKDDIANSDSRLRGWDIQTLHFLVGYDAAVVLKSWGPFVQIEYDYPIAGKFVWPTDMIGGTVGASATWKF
jgi:hypothetical protein